MASNLNLAFNNAGADLAERPPALEARIENELVEGPATGVSPLRVATDWVIEMNSTLMADKVVSTGRPTLNSPHLL
jgi:hypothetical protein